jgi:hypothetical protein
LCSSGKDTDSSALEEEGDDLKAMEAKIRCMGMKKKPSQGTNNYFFLYFTHFGSNNNKKKKKKK